MTTKNLQFRAQHIAATKKNCEQDKRRKFIAHAKACQYEAILTCDWQTNYRIGLWTSPRKKWPDVWGTTLKTETELIGYLNELVEMDGKGLK